MTLSELIEHLSMLAEGLDFDEVEVKLAHQQGYPFELSIGELSIGEPALHDPLAEWEEENALTCSDDPDYEEWLADRAIAEGKPKIIFIPEGSHQGYLRSSVAKQLGWR